MNGGGGLSSKRYLTILQQHPKWLWRRLLDRLSRENEFAERPTAEVEKTDGGAMRGLQHAFERAADVLRRDERAQTADRGLVGHCIPLQWIRMFESSHPLADGTVMYSAIWCGPRLESFGWIGKLRLARRWLQFFGGIGSLIQAGTAQRIGFPQVAHCFSQNPSKIHISSAEFL